MDHLLDCLLCERRWPDVLEWGERWVALGHAPEPAFRALMLAHSERGDRGRVADIYRRCREALFEELGAQPSPQTRTLYERLARGEQVLPAAPLPEASVLRGVTGDEPPAPGEPPFQGLQYFDADDAGRFFGREPVVARLVDRLQTEQFLTLVGASGSGKSSVVRAGLVPAVRGARLADGSAAWLVHVLTPTARPLEALAGCLTPPNGSLAEITSLLHALGRDPRSLRLHLRRTLPCGRRALLVVDQFEELFTLCRDPFEREAFDHRASTRRAFLCGFLGASCAGLVAACGQVTQLAPTAAPTTVAAIPTTAPTSTAASATAVSAASGEGYLVDNPPSVRNAAEAKRFSSQTISLYSFSLSDRVDDAIAKRFTQDTGIEVQIPRSPLSIGTSSTARFEFYQRLLQAHSTDVDAILIDVIWPGALATWNCRLGQAGSTGVRQARSWSQRWPGTSNNRLVGNHDGQKQSVCRSWTRPLSCFEQPSTAVAFCRVQPAIPGAIHDVPAPSATRVRTKRGGLFRDSQKKETAPVERRKCLTLTHGQGSSMVA
jgi:energy-coupling factor transporter ATP-binding protein EcfA2